MWENGTASTPLLRGGSAERKFQEGRHRTAHRAARPQPPDRIARARTQDDAVHPPHARLDPHRGRLDVARGGGADPAPDRTGQAAHPVSPGARSEEHTSELQSLMRISYAVFCLKKNKLTPDTNDSHELNHSVLCA